jgi:class 3 adenylate cyclase/tetratricopeptide (TPR) repeat protein
VICSSCGTQNEAGRKFCDACGKTLLSACPSCGASNRPGARFCGECAAPLTGPAPAPAATVAQAVVPPRAPAPVAERRLVSVLFADLVGFTALSEGRDAEDTRELLSRYFDLSHDLIARYGGTVEKFIGDAVMAVWGAPIAHEDDAERAVRAALELVDAVKGLGPMVHGRAGVLTGEAAVTIGATNQGMVAGDLVNTASRLQAVAAPGTVLVGESTQRAAHGAIAFEAAGVHTLKGKASPVPAWRALRVVAERGGRNRTEVLEAPFVGRDDELRLIKDLFHATAREGRARLVSVVGPAGIGKTRLAWEFSKYIDGVVDTTYWHAGRSPAYGEGISFWALGEMVRRRAGLFETDDEATTRAKIAETVARWIPDGTERPWIEQALLALLGVGDAPPGGREELFAAWRTFFERIAAEGTVTLVFEDFHYADSGLLDFVDHLMEWSRGVPIYVLTLSRPDLLERRPDWGAGKRNFNSLYLEPLAPSEMRELLAGLVPGLPAATVKVIVDRADGIPLYAVETVRMLLAGGRLALEGGTYRPVGDLTNLAVPETLTALIASRLDGLSPDDRALVSDAAVLGQSFTLAGLSAVSGLAEAELESRLRDLVRRELLALDTDPRSPERGQYAFVQALIREVAYGSLAKPDRKRRHLAAARFFESLGTDEIAGGLAGHYLAAYNSSPEGPEADELAARARVALKAAAERAVALGAHAQSLTFLEQALTVTSEPSETAELLEHAGGAASMAGHHDTAEALLGRALEAQRALGNRAAIARATAALGAAFLPARTARALAVLEPAAGELAELGTDPEYVALLGQLARAYFLHEKFEQAISVADRALAAAERADLQAIVADTLVTKGTALATMGRPTEGLGLIAAGQVVAEANGLGLTVLRANTNRTSIEAARDPRAALAIAQACLALARRLGSRTTVALAIGNGVGVAIRTGDWAWALVELEAGLAEGAEAADRLLLLEASVKLQALRGEPVADHMGEMRSLVGASTDPAFVSSLSLAAAEAAFAAGQLPKAREQWHLCSEATAEYIPVVAARAARAALWTRDAAAAREDLAALDESGFHGPAVEADRTTLRAGLAAIEGHNSESLGLYLQALRAWRDLGLAWDEALCGLDMAILLDPADPQVRGVALAARQTLSRLQAKPFVARLDTALELVPAEEAAEGARSADRLKVPASG